MILKRIKSLLKKEEKKDKEKKGLILFENTKDAMKAEKILSKYNIKVVAPPPEIREGCDLAIEYDLIDEFGIKGELEKNNIEPIKFIPIDDYSLKPLELIKIKEVDGFVMVRCGNMKITLDKEGNIVNISGGGCPDVPYLTLKLKGRNIKDIKEDETPKNLGYTLCAYTLNKAFEKAKELVMKDEG
ncbi:DUF3343 domain-containing protein [Methanotorris formicicus]|uniref:Uncharacterized protein n=1 Tax=Methanotorris formicicus Mc-S-70 TaxID=647171 RepID=H1KXN7_9EURY|nr:DUF3343 domain-containing protein [Methanotorris formicicus]EHP88110.1 hypothetical protein MetfoDRAFT_0560 [Methanotorris formicicus Mc-S-70]